MNEPGKEKRPLTLTPPKVLLPVTRLVSTLSMTVLNGQLCALPCLKIGPAS